MKAYLFSTETDELCLFRLMGIEGSSIKPEALADAVETCVRQGDYALVLIAKDLADRAGLTPRDLPQSTNCLCTILPRAGFAEYIAGAGGQTMPVGGTDGQY